ncbi:MAG: CoA transferase [Burkholderiaceae bacterium]
MINNQWKTVKFEPKASGALDGLRVLDLSRLVAGNMASLQLADFGADVIKVEQPPNGDPLRAWKLDGIPTFWKAYGRNKRSLALDFHGKGSIDLLRQLIGSADVLIEGFRPGTLEKMGLAPDSLLADNPKLVVLRISGFGQTGPYSARPGFGTLVEAMSGFAHRNGESDGGPLLPPLALADMISGVYGVSAVMMALYARNRTGHGQVIDLALLDAMTSVLGPEAMDYQVTPRPKPRVGNGSNTSSPRNVYITRDGHGIALSASVQTAAQRLFTSIGRDDMNSDPRFATNVARIAHSAEVDAIVGGWIAERTRDETMAHFETEGITAAPIYNIEDIVGDAHFIERGIYVNTPDDTLGQAAVHSPLPKLSATPGTLRRPAPEIGADTKDILRDCGLSESEIAAALTQEIVFKSKSKN